MSVVRPAVEQSINDVLADAGEKAGLRDVDAQGLKTVTQQVEEFGSDQAVEGISTSATESLAAPEVVTGAVEAGTAVGEAESIVEAISLILIL